MRHFKIASEEAIAKDIDQVKQSHPRPINQLVQFRYNKSLYFMLLDETANDNEVYILEQIHQAKSDAAGEILKNPESAIVTYGMPFKGKDVYLFRSLSGKKRLDAFLAEKYSDYSRSTWQKFIKNGYITVNGIVAKSASQEVSESDAIAISIPELADYSDKTLPIIYLDDNVIVVDKPAGILTHSKGALNDEFTVADFFRNYTAVGLDTNRPGVVHRLDRDTSGVIIGARTPEAFELLKKQFSERKVKKTYIAITDGIVTPSAAVIDIPIGRNPSSPSTFRPDPNGKPAQTVYKTISATNNNSVVRLQPKTGRTHQLRAHMKYLGTPIHGDRVYGKAADRLYLHAKSLEITICPNIRKTFVSPLPSEFFRLVPELKNDTTI